MDKKNSYLLFYYSKGNRYYTYIEGTNIQEAWDNACTRYGEENLEFLS